MRCILDSVSGRRLRSAAPFWSIGVQMGRENQPLDWLIPQRHRVLTSASHLLDLVHENKKVFLKDQNAEDVAGLLIGTAFSLWRAVFLAPNDPTTGQAIIDKGAEFLDKFLRDNSIGYGDEKSNREWSFGYYLNSARFRLFHSKRIQSGNPDGWEKKYDFLKETRSAGKDIDWEWQRHVGVFEEELAEFQKRLRP
jgi:hypothetical protein